MKFLNEAPNILYMMNEQSSSAVYGLFYDVDYEGSNLLGIYFLEGEAGAAREAYIAEQLEEFPEEDHANEREYYEATVRVKRLAVGQAPSLNFAA